MPRASRVTWAAAAAVLACAGCTPAEDAPSSSPTPSPPSSSPVDSSPSASDAVPRYLRDYTPRQRRAYAEAVAARDAFDLKQAKILSVGKATTSARRYYRRHSGAWLNYWNRLRQREADGIRVLGRGKTLHVRPAAIRLGDDSGTLDLRVCGVAEGVEVLQNGEPIPQPQAEPRIVDVRLIKLENDPSWRVLWERPGEPC